MAKDIYVRPKSGWFSDRSVCYLASGRPVVTMATEFSRFYPVGEGLFEYTDKAGALAAIAAVNADYARHAKAARAAGRGIFRQRPRCRQDDAGRRALGCRPREPADCGAVCAWRTGSG